MKSTKHILNLREFLMRREVLKTYKEIFKLINRIPDAGYRSEMGQWARRDFKANKNVKEETTIKIELARAKMSLKDLETSMRMAR